jgi:hypothetical protein
VHVAVYAVPTVAGPVAGAQLIVSGAVTLNVTDTEDAAAPEGVIFTVPL